MKTARQLVAIALLLVCGTEVRAQILIGPPPVGPVGGWGVGFGYGRRNLVIAGGIGRTYYGYPGFGFPGFGYGGGYASVTYVYSPPPQVIVAPPIIINNNINVNPPENPADGGREARGPNPLDDERFLKIMPRKRKPDEVAAAPRMPGEPAGGFRKVDPRERIRPEAPPAKKAEKPAPELPGKPGRAADNPKDENARQVALAREAFAAGEYGRAERRLAQAVRVAPNEPLAYFLLAQAQIALGQFREAVDALEEGSRRKPAWPGERFRIRDLYGENEDDFAEHRKRLEETLERNPNDFFLLFLRGYELWFEGKQAEARGLFQRAEKVAPEKYKALVNRFLLHGMPIARGQ